MKQGAHVYVVDDDKDIRNSLKWLLESVGLQVSTYDSAEQFLETYADAGPGCLILDIRMPGMGGLQLLERHEVPLPVIMLTGHGDTVMAVRAMKAGAFDFIEKPASHQELLERINEAIERSRIMHTQRVERVRFIEAQSRLSPREFEVMQGVVKGQASKAIAIALELSERTVEKHRKSIMAKMQTDSLAELIRLFILYGGEPP